MIPLIDAYLYRQGASGPEWLLLHRAPGKLYAGAWRMVGGKVEDGESAWQAAIREAREETGIAIQRMWALPSVNTFYDWKTDTVMVAAAFAVEVDGRVQLDDEHDQAEFLPLEQARSRLEWPEQRRLLSLADEMLRSNRIPSQLEIPLSLVGEQNS